MLTRRSARPGRRIGAAAIAFVVALTIVAPAAAHARLTLSSPASGSALPTVPGTFTLTFSEEIDLGFSAAVLLAADETEIALGPLALGGNDRTLTVTVLDPATVAPGTYSLVWRVLSAADGHASTGVIAFSAGTGVTPTTVDAANARPPWWRIAIRWLHFATIILIAGACFFSIAVARRPGSSIPGWRALTATAAATFAMLVPISGYDAGIASTSRGFLDPPSLATYQDLLVSSNTGRAWWTLSVCGLIAALSIWLAGRSDDAVMFERAGLIASAAALLSLSAAGHAAAALPAWRSIAIDWVHQLGVATWLGSLPVLVLAIRRSDPETGVAALATWLSRFSRYGLVAMATIFVTGFLRASEHVDGTRSLVTSDYGRVLIAKHLLLVVVLVAAAINLLLVVPRLRRPGASVEAGVQTARRFVTIELGAAAFVVLAAAALTQLPPADAPLTVDVAAPVFHVDDTRQAAELTVRLVAVLDGGVGDAYEIFVSAPDGAAPGDVQRLIVTTSTTVSGVGAGDRFDADPAATPGAYRFPAVRLGLRAPWALDVTVRRAGLEDVSASFTVDTTNAGAPPPRLVEDEWRMPRVTIVSWMFLLLGLTIFVGGLALVRQLPALEPFAGSILLTMSLLIAAGFAVQGVRQAIPVTASTSLANPLAVDTGAVTRGAATYDAMCLQCHGPSGIGINKTDDPEHPHTAGTNLTDATTQRQRDGDLYESVSAGVPGTDMPAYDIALTDTQRWELVTYLRTLDGQSDGGTPEAGDS